MNNETKTPHPHADLIKAWTDGAKIQIYLGFFSEGNVFKTEKEAEVAVKRLMSAFRGEEPEELKKLRKENEELKAEVAKLDLAQLNLSDGEKALIEALRLTPSFEPLWGNFKVLDCEDETLIGLATVAVDTGNWVASPHRIFQALKQIAEEKRKGGEQ